MCGRFAFWSDKNRILQHYGLQDAPELFTGYNIPPSARIPVFRDHNGRELVHCHWGFIPHWARDRKFQPINARADTLQAKPFFRDAFRNRRCLIPANGYYEWQVKDGRKQPWFIHLKNAELFSFAGLWDRWERPEESIESCAIITTEANLATAAIHKRMPVIIEPEDYAAWLQEGATGLLKPYPGEMEAFPVSARVNSPKDQGEELIRPVPR